MSQYKYYFRKPRSEIVKDVLKALVLTGAIGIAATSPYFGVNLMRYFRRAKKYKKNERKNIYNTFYRLRREGCLEFSSKNHQLYISLTEKGKKMAGRFQIDSLEVKKPLRWDKKWRLVVFDIPDRFRVKREAFRGKLREIGLCQLQKSVWIHPYNCRDEIELLREFFGLDKKQVRLIVADDIEEDLYIKGVFKLG
mgnify:FL=1